MLLNFGHTIGHGIEAYYNYKKYSHGEAVAIGMHYITHIGENLGLTKVGCSEKIISILKQYKLPYEVLGIDSTKLLDIIAKDKKVFDKGLNFIVIKDIGEAFINNIPIEEIDKYLKI
jgi:3-dehydroquinate synthetase